MNEEQNRERADVNITQLDPEVVLIVGAWSKLPVPLRAGVMAMIKAALGNE